MNSAPVFRFASARTANHLVAGVPAAARLARAWQTVRPNAPLVLWLKEEHAISRATAAEIARLAPGLTLRITQEAAAGLEVAAEPLLDADTMCAWLGGGPLSAAPEAPEKVLKYVERRLIRATAKPGDGIVSRYLNRPVSQSASALLLRATWVRPGHATALTAVIALAMLACLLFGSAMGLIAGAVLFQCASIADGIDGEIARATFRTSPEGAAWDSAIDAITNLGFIIGLSANFWLRENSLAASLGVAGLIILSAGLGLLGLHARAKGEPLHFDGAKRLVAARETALMRWMRYVTMRDFYCLFFAVMVVLGYGEAALTIFTLAAAIWLAMVISLLRPAEDV